VYGFARRESWFRANCSTHLAKKIDVVFGDMAEGTDITAALQEAEPDEVYNLASQSRPGESWARAPETLVVNGLGAIRLFEAVRNHRPQCRVYHASSSEMFGEAYASPQNEGDALQPGQSVRRGQGLRPRDGAHLPRQLWPLHLQRDPVQPRERTPAAALPHAEGGIRRGVREAGIADSPELNERGRPVVESGKLALGNLDIARDWGYASDYVRAMWMMLQQDRADDFVIGTGKLHTLKDLCEAAYRSVGRDWRECVVSDPALVRPLESGPNARRCHQGAQGPGVAADRELRGDDRAHGFGPGKPLEVHEIGNEKGVDHRRHRPGRRPTSPSSSSARATRCTA
jgi:GDPmannose 4,6-dehydratase